MKSKWKLGAEQRFERLGQRIVQNPKLFVALSFLLVCISLSFTPRIQFDTTLEGFLERDSEPLARYQLFREVFGQDLSLVVAVEADEIMTPQTLQRIHALSLDLENKVPGINRVDSIISSYTMVSENDEIVAEPFIDANELNAANIALKKRWLAEHDSYLSRLVADSSQMTLLFLEMDMVFSLSEDESDLLYSQSIADQEAIRTVGHDVSAMLLQHEVEGFKLAIAGAPTVLAQLEDYVIEDIKTFLFLVMIVLSGILVLWFRRISGVILPMTVVNMAMITTIGLMPAFGQPIQIPTGILPTFLLAIGVGDSIHLLVYFYRNYQHENEKNEAIIYALKRTGLPMLMTTVTTAAGLCSFATSDVVPIANLGVFSAIGVVMAFIFTIILLPALLCLVPIKAGRHVDKEETFAPLKRIHQFSMFLATKHARKTVVASLAIMATSLYLALQLGFSFNPLKWIPDDAPLRATMTQVDQQFDGTIPIEIVIDTGEARGIVQKDVLQAIEKANDAFKDYKTDQVEVGYIASVNDLVREMNRVLHDEKRDAYDIPQDQSEMAQNLFLLELVAGNLLHEYVDQDLQKMRITVMLPWVDMKYYTELVAGIDAHYQQYLPEGVTVESTGIVPLLSFTFTGVVGTTMESYGIAFVLISLLMIVVVGELRLGVISMLPNLAPIVFVLGFLSLIGTPLDLMTILIGSVAIGLAVDDTIHFVHSFQHAYDRHGTFEKALQETLETTGAALLVTTISLSAGFLVLVSSNMMMVSNFGLAISVAISFALIFDFFMLPSLIAVFAKVEMAGNVEDHLEKKGLIDGEPVFVEETDPSYQRKVS